MILKILLILAIVLQLFAAGVAVRLTRTTKFNSSWILITIALVIMVFLRYAEFSEVIDKKYQIDIPADLLVWLGVLTSLCFAAGVFMIRKILVYIAQMEQKRRTSEKRILNAIIQAEERERQRFSKELHDGMGPLLSSVKMSVSALARMDNNTVQKEIIANADFVLNEAIKSVKEISNNLSPHILNNFGVARALNSFIQKLSLPDKTKVLFRTNLKGERFAADTEVVMYRVVCELINNSLKHADASRIEVDIKLENDHIIINFEDNGIGFDTSKEYTGMGLSNIASRIGSLKGDFLIDSSEGEGTVVKINMGTKS